MIETPLPCLFFPVMRAGNERVDRVETPVIIAPILPVKWRVNSFSESRRQVLEIVQY